MNVYILVLKFEKALYNFMELGTGRNLYCQSLNDNRSSTCYIGSLLGSSFFTGTLELWYVKYQQEESFYHDFGVNGKREQVQLEIKV